MKELLTVGERLRYFAQEFFSSISVFARSMGYKSPGSLYDYFANAKQPGIHFQDRFRQIGGNPYWLRYGSGPVFADNTAGTILRERFAQHPVQGRQTNAAERGESPPTFPPESALVHYSIRNETPMETADEDEELYLLMNRIFFKVKSRKRIAAEVLQMYKATIGNIHAELQRMEEQRDIAQRMAHRSLPNKQ